MKALSDYLDLTSETIVGTKPLVGIHYYPFIHCTQLSLRITSLQTRLYNININSFSGFLINTDAIWGCPC